jgi:hypothetical protein
MNIVQRRRYSRVRFRGMATFQSGSSQWPCKVLDLSLRGALLAVDIPDLTPDTPCLLELNLSGESCVRMTGRIVHRYRNQVGIACDETDLDSIAHLRRLLALNLGDATLLEREFSALLTDRN